MLVCCMCVEQHLSQDAIKYACCSMCLDNSVLKHEKDKYTIDMIMRDARVAIRRIHSYDMWIGKAGKQSVPGAGRPGESQGDCVPKDCAVCLCVTL